MKLNKTKLALCLLAASTVSMSVASYASQFGTADTAVLNFTIENAAEASTIEVNPVSALPPAGVSISADTPIATVTNTINNGGSEQSGIRFTPQLTGQSVDVGNEIATLDGTNPSNKLTLKMDTTNAADQASWVTVNSDVYYVTNSPVSSQTLNVNLGATQVIAADTYTLSMDGVTYSK